MQARPAGNLTGEISIWRFFEGENSPIFAEKHEYGRKTVATDQKFGGRFLKLPFFLPKTVLYETNIRTLASDSWIINCSAYAT